MTNFDDYFEDRSEAEQIIDDATDKLVGLISEKTKSEIERYKNWYESSDKMRAELQKQVYEQQEKIRVLEVDLKRAKEELERKDNEIPKVPFMPGDKVWFIGNDCINGVTVECPICKGRGKVKTQTADYGEVEITCPHCKGNNTSKNHYININGITKTISQWSDESGVPSRTIWARIIELGWESERAVFEPLRGKRHDK